MPWYSYAAVYFIVWWLVLFAVLPFGVRSQQEEGHVAEGTERGAPSRFGVGRTLLVTTLVSLIVYAAYFGVTDWLGYSFDDIPQIIPSAG
ncbi:DUF1467 family protein [Pararhizobium mangrovi]|uniref:DUF1467 family protein n=1 Tax=Pararhizobium mangrovi TaxID=2590452 RepID=A0A506UF68_9HYPH|nr:DUF1467 family protein [Pararhizobium mangrovi]TPW30437.1 DUF1467 family protein [Pararhizobium mangrovi]